MKLCVCFCPTLWGEARSFGRVTRQKRYAHLGRVLNVAANQAALTLAFLGKIGMRLIIKATNFHLTPAIRAYLEKKIGELEKFIRLTHRGSQKFPGGRDPVEARVEIGKTTQHHRHGNVFRAEVTLVFPKRSLRAEAEQWDLRVAIDTVKDELQRELKKAKGKSRAQMLRGARAAKRAFRLSPSAQSRRRPERIRQEGQ